MNNLKNLFSIRIINRKVNAQVRKSFDMKKRVDERLGHTEKMGKLVESLKG